MTDDLKERLLPCPFCGGRAAVRTNGDWTKSIWCQTCRAMNGGGKLEYAIELWNRRALPAASQPEAKWTGMGGGIAPKFDPNCECVCHSQPGVMHVAPCCQPQPEAEPVAQTSSAVENLIALIGQYGLFMGEAWRVGEGAEIMDAYQAAYDEFATPAPVVPADGLEWAICNAEAAISGYSHLSRNVQYNLAVPINVGQLRDMIAALRAQQPAAPVSGATVQEAGWLPIETAPRNGDMVLLTGFLFDRPSEGRWVATGEYLDEEWRERDGSPLHPPTHWMPLPEPPALSALKGK